VSHRGLLVDGVCVELVEDFGWYDGVVFGFVYFFVVWVDYEAVDYRVYLWQVVVFVVCLYHA